MLTRPAKAPRTTGHPSESDLSTACQKRVRVDWLGEVLKTHGASHQRRGEPDLLICVMGRLIAIELKQPGKRPTPLQMKRLRSWEAVGAVAGWATTVAELDDLIVHADDFGWKNPALARP